MAHSLRNSLPDGLWIISGRSLDPYGSIAEDPVIGTGRAKIGQVYPSPLYTLSECCRATDAFRIAPSLSLDMNELFSSVISQKKHGTFDTKELIRETICQKWFINTALHVWKKNLSFLLGRIDSVSYIEWGCVSVAGLHKTVVLEWDLYKTSVVQVLKGDRARLYNKLLLSGLKTSPFAVYDSLYGLLHMVADGSSRRAFRWNGYGRFSYIYFF